jgi:hypothetical protein
MALDIKRARRLLKASGLPDGALRGLAWPFGREKRALALFRQRLAVLQCKNNIVDYLFRSQRGLAELCLTTVEQARDLLQDPEKRRLIMALAVVRAMLEDVLSSNYKSEVGRTLDQALAELINDGVVLRLPAEMLASHSDAFVAVHSKDRPHYDAAPITNLLQESRDYGKELRTRLKHTDSSGRGRTYRM